MTKLNKKQNDDFFTKSVKYIKPYLHDQLTCHTKPERLKILKNLLALNPLKGKALTKKTKHTHC